MLSTDQIEIHQLQPLVWPSDLLYVMLAGCDWWISIRSVDNKHDWRKFWKRFRGYFVFQSRVSTKTVVSDQSISKVPSNTSVQNKINWLWFWNVNFCKDHRDKAGRSTGSSRCGNTYAKCFQTLQKKKLRWGYKWIGVKKVGNTTRQFKHNDAKDRKRKCCRFTVGSVKDLISPK